MDFLVEFIAESIKYVILIGVATCGVLLGIFARKKKNEKAANESTSES